MFVLSDKRDKCHGRRGTKKWLLCLTQPPTSTQVVRGTPRRTHNATSISFSYSTNCVETCLRGSPVQELWCMYVTGNGLRLVSTSHVARHVLNCTKLHGISGVLRARLWLHASRCSRCSRCSLVLNVVSMMMLHLPMKSLNGWAVAQNASTLRSPLLIQQLYHHYTHTTCQSALHPGALFLPSLQKKSSRHNLLALAANKKNIALQTGSS